MSDHSRSVICYAHGQDGDWEALCIDYDIAVQGASFAEVQQALDEAVRLFLADVEQEAPLTRLALLRRKAPWPVRLSMTMKLLAYNLFHSRRTEALASFPVTCPA